MSKRVFRGRLFAVIRFTVRIGLLGAARRKQKARLYVESVGDRNIHDTADVEARPGVVVELVSGFLTVLAVDVREAQTGTDSVRDFALLVRTEHVAELLGGGCRNACQKHCGQHEAFLHHDKENLGTPRLRRCGHLKKESVEPFVYLAGGSGKPKNK